nr:MAG TPA: hypothetical protein [Bacteriophage sp.]
MNEITKIEKHLYKYKNGKQKTMYRVYRKGNQFGYNNKYPSSLTKLEKEFFDKYGKYVIHF